MVIGMLVNISMGSRVAMVSITGQTVPPSKATSKTVFAMARASGRNPKTNNPIATKANTQTTRNVGTESSPGSAETSTKGTTSRICGMATARCTGLMGLAIRGSG